MRRGEKALVTIKPKWGFRHPDLMDKVRIPQGWESEEKLKILRKRRIYYEVKLYDWIVRHDLDADGMLIKTIHDRGVGYDRPFDFDELVLDLKVYQIVDGKEVIYQQLESQPTFMHERKHVSLILKKILQSMKTKERVSC